MATPKQKARNNRMFQAALEEFSRCGFHQTSVDSIAAKAGVSKATLYSHFGTKEALFLAVFEMVLKQTIKPPSSKTKSMGLEAAFRTGLRNFFSNISNTPETRFFFQCMISSPEILRQDLSNELANRFTSVLMGELDEFQQAQKDGKVYSHLNLKLVQQAIIGILLQTLRYWLQQEKSISIKSLADQLSSMLAYGLAVPGKDSVQHPEKSSKTGKTRTK